MIVRRRKRRQAGRTAARVANLLIMWLVDGLRVVGVIRTNCNVMKMSI